MTDASKSEKTSSNPMARSGSLFGAHPGSVHFSVNFDPKAGAPELGHHSEPVKVAETSPQTAVPAVPPRPYTSKHMGDACEMLVASEMTLAGVPARKMPDNWPCYDVIAQPRDGGAPQRISAKSRTFKRGGDTFVVYKDTDEFDWLAIVLLPGDNQTIAELT